MASSRTADARPKMLHTSRSFTRMDPAPVPESPRKRAATLAAAGIPTIPEAKHIATSPEMAGKHNDIFETEEEHEQDPEDTHTPGLQLPSKFDELPIEIRSLSERFIESLSAKVHPTPLTADALSELFQDFYLRAESQIATHIASLASRIGREKSPTPSNGSRASLKGRPRAGSGTKSRDATLDEASGGEMLTASEVADRKKARRLLELKRIALEEAVELAVCEKVYDRIFKHKGTDDDARDEKLRSRTAALALVGIGLKELHMDSDPAKVKARQTAEEKEGEIHESLTSAREALQQMDNERHPSGKLQHLIAAHKCIVDTLANNFPSSSSADEILPTLIYALITSPPEGINVVSNLNFIQRFRAASKVDGEAAYCLVNLEAAISFLETVDLSSLRADELPEGPPKSNSVAPTPTVTERPVPLVGRLSEGRSLPPALSSINTTSEMSSSGVSASEALPSPMTPTTTAATRPKMHQRKLSSMMQAQADRIEAGRQDFLSTADRAFDTINNTLDNSFKFVLGKFKEQTPDSSPLPKTLEDARKLVNSPRAGEDEDLSGSGRSTPTLDDPLNAGGKTNDGRLLEMIGGTRAQLRDRSVDSAKSVGSSKRVAFAKSGLTEAQKAPPKDEPFNAAANFITSMNPLNRFGVPAFPRFGRSPSAQSPATQPSPPNERAKQPADIVASPVTMQPGELAKLEKTISRETNATDGLNAAEALAELKSTAPPSRRFLEVADASELKIGEIDDLLREYRRLAKAIADAIAS